MPLYIFPPFFLSSHSFFIFVIPNKTNLTMPEGFKVDVEKAVGFKSPVEIVRDP
jgi:hypothetical protein